MKPGIANLNKAKLNSLLVNKTLVSSATVCLSLAVLATMAYKGWGQISGFEWRINYWALVVAFLLYSLALFLAVLGWHLMFRGIAGSNGFWQDAKIYVVSNVARRLPGGLWGIASRVYLYKLEGFSEMITLAVLVMEAFVITLANLLTIPFFAPFLPLGQGFSLSWLIWLLALAGIVFLLHPRILKALFGMIVRRFMREGDLPLKPIGFGTFALWVPIYIGIWLLGGTVAFSIASSIYPIEIEYLPAVIAAWLAAGILSTVVYFFPSGLGITELTLAAVLSVYVPSPVAVASALALRVFLTAYETLWALAVLKRL